MNRQDIDELTEVFVEESQEIVESLEKDVLDLEQYVEHPETLDRELINNIFRYVHTLKGNSGLAGADKLRDLAHKLESLLDRLRKDKMPLTGAMVNILFAGIDRFKEMLQEIITGTDRGVVIADLLDHLEIILAGGSLDAAAIDSLEKPQETSAPPPEVSAPAATLASSEPHSPESVIIPDDIKRILTEYEETR